MSDSQSMRRLRALAWEARRRGVSYGVLCTQLGPGEEKEILRRYAQAMGIKLTQRKANPQPKETWPFDVGRARELYDNECNDVEIAHQMGSSKNTIRRWRLSLGLPCRNPQRFPSETARTLYAQGYRDDAIAARIGRSEGAVRAWRYREGLGVPAQKTGGQEDG